MKINKPGQKLTKINLGEIINNYKTKHSIGFTINEIRDLLRPNNIEEDKFIVGTFGNTYAKIDNDDVYYHRDVYNILEELVK